MIAGLVLAAALHSTDQWSYLFDHGDRWPTCTVTITATAPVDRKPFWLARRDIRRTTGIRIRRTPDSGQVTVIGADLPPYQLGSGLSQPVDGRYTRGTVYVNWSLRRERPRLQRGFWQHELGHILGLGHRRNPSEVMYAGITGRRTTPKYVADLRNLYPECK